MTYIHTQFGSIDLNDIPVEAMTAHALANTLSKINRFAGRTTVPWPVAAHSVVVSRLCQAPPEQAWALLHDAHEAFIGDIITPAVSWIADHVPAPTRGDVVHDAVHAAKDALDLQVVKAWNMDLDAIDFDEVAACDQIAFQAESIVFLNQPIRDGMDPRIGDAIALMYEMSGANWNYARNLWVDEVLAHAKLGHFSPPRIIA